MNEYAVYKGDTFLTLGTAEECAAELGIKPSSVKWMATSTGRKRFESRKDQSSAMTAIKIEPEGVA